MSGNEHIDVGNISIDVLIVSDLIESFDRKPRIQEVIRMARKRCVIHDFNLNRA